jgi:hypothetical protein
MPTCNRCGQYKFAPPDRLTTEPCDCAACPDCRDGFVIDSHDHYPRTCETCGGSGRASRRCCVCGAPATTGLGTQYCAACWNRAAAYLKTEQDAAIDALQRAMQVRRRTLWERLDADL